MSERAADAVAAKPETVVDRARRADPRTVAAALVQAPEGYAASVVADGAQAALLVALAACRARPSVERPQIIAATTVHADLHRAAHLVGAELTLVDVESRTLRADPVALARAFTERTVLVVASAPSYPHGVLDPIRDIAEAAEDFDLPVHVDATCGGWALAHVSGAAEWGFARHGVSSVALGTRADGPASDPTVVLHRSLSMRHGQFWALVDWPGPPVVAPSPGSAGVFAAAPAAHAGTPALGTDEYAAAARQAHQAAEAFAAGVRAIPELLLLAQPEAMTTAVAAGSSCDVYTVADHLRARGHAAVVQLPFRDVPASVRLAWTLDSAPAEQVLADLQAAAAAAVSAGPARPDPTLAAMVRDIDPVTLDADTVEAVLSAAGIHVGADGLRLPDRMAPVYALLAECHVPVREALVVAVAERL